MTAHGEEKLLETMAEIEALLERIDTCLVGILKGLTLITHTLKPDVSFCRVDPVLLAADVRLYNERVMHKTTPKEKAAVDRWRAKRERQAASE